MVLEKGQKQYCMPLKNKKGQRLIRNRKSYIPELPDIMEAKGVVHGCNTEDVLIVKTHPILCDQIPSMPQKGIKTVNTFVTMN